MSGIVWKIWWGNPKYYFGSGKRNQGRDTFASESFIGNNAEEEVEVQNREFKELGEKNVCNCRR